MILHAGGMGTCSRWLSEERATPPDNDPNKSAPRQGCQRCAHDWHPAGMRCQPNQYPVVSVALRPQPPATGFPCLRHEEPLNSDSAIGLRGTGDPPMPLKPPKPQGRRPAGRRTRHARRVRYPNPCATTSNRTCCAALIPIVLANSRKIRVGNARLPNQPHIHRPETLAIQH